ncbi:hypothetical protein AVEN_109003-1 [Araneus ventricosus]|uniref:Tc1-like transposase DDE domain-containing protein n=1 Tax=Araneus ventricosus TaxID=182803 RepID=A0A4Y2X090_ARAVE|nr:hypothetical protein AVEN_100635-1 [Araneus ventricosus]GBO41599.1 hypothetical protein AVEN_44417-1 [Araneus ventricosus]GBO41601.1 hypothetical protein AVEN_109003-1 [Araneus ventricosus]
MSFRSRRTTIVPLLTARHKALCIACARQHSYWTVDNWKPVAGLTCVVTNCIGRMDMYGNGSDRYVTILYDHLYPFIPIVDSDGFRQFQQDNATPHTSSFGTEWLQEYISDIRHFHRLSKSPDMNIIEHIWYALQRTVQKRSPPSLTPMDL